MENQPTVAVLGLGAWGKILQGLVQAQGILPLSWHRTQGELVAAGLERAQILISALPMRAVREVACQVAQLNLPTGTIIVSATKGLEPGTVQTAAQIWQELLPQATVVVLSGPNLAAEIQQGLPAATVVAGEPKATEQVQTLLANPNFRVYTNTDHRGVELGGILKNVIAIACGANDGLELGVNARSALITRGLVEMVRVGQHWGGEVLTLYGLSGLGDLLATCTSPLSRNYQVGYKLAEGMSLEQAIAEITGTAEGVNTALVLAEYANQQGLDVPITQEVQSVLRGQHSPTQALANLLERPFKAELTKPS
jgi:glycerol-3-phosphate dehydrogenase (NAD(P)+)